MTLDTRSPTCSGVAYKPLLYCSFRKIVVPKRTVTRGCATVTSGCGSLYSPGRLRCVHRATIAGKNRPAPAQRRESRARGGLRGPGWQAPRASSLEPRALRCNTPNDDHQEEAPIETRATVRAWGREPPASGALIPLRSHSEGTPATVCPTWRRLQDLAEDAPRQSRRRDRGRARLSNLVAQMPTWRDRGMSGSAPRGSKCPPQFRKGP